jgi:ribosomal protein S14
MGSKYKVMDRKRRQKYKEAEVKRRIIKMYMREGAAYGLRYLIGIGGLMGKIDRDTSKVRIRNRCIWTGRGRGVIRKGKMSRIKMRDKIRGGDLMGFRKSIR